MMLGRIGAMIGNLVFPFLLQTGCAPPFLSVGLVILGNITQFNMYILNTTSFIFQVVLFLHFYYRILI
jgi:hypothetical protein